MKYFQNCSTLEELKAEYKKLVKKYHPDRGGDNETMKQINNEYEKAFEILKDQHNKTADAAHQTTETPFEFIEIVDKLMKMQGLIVELCGSWLWISGDTYNNKDGLKAAGCKWSNNKKMWYWRHEEDARPYRGKSRTMDQIRSKYGSQYLKGSAPKAAEIEAA